MNWQNLVQWQMPMWMRRPRMLAWLFVLIHEVQTLHAAYLIYRSRSLYALQITGQTVYLEKALNDRWDFLARGIYIETIADGSQLYLYNKIEAAAPLYIYNKFDADRSYVVGEYATAGTRVWRCAATPAGVPEAGNPAWTDMGPRPYLRNKAEGITTIDFIVWVPVGVAFDTPEMRALIDLYKQAGKVYTINTY